MPEAAERIQNTAAADVGTRGTGAVGDVVYVLSATATAVLVIRPVTGGWSVAVVQGVVFGLVLSYRTWRRRRRSGQVAAGSAVSGGGRRVAARTELGRPLARWSSPWLPAWISISSGTVLAMAAVLYLAVSAGTALAIGLTLAQLVPASAFMPTLYLVGGSVAVLAGLKIRKLLFAALYLVHRLFPVEAPPTRRDDQFEETDSAGDSVPTARPPGALSATPFNDHHAG